MQTGNFIVESYPGETFNFSTPEIFNILLSYKKGLFVYTPLIFASLLLIITGIKLWHKRFIFLITFSVFTYVTASWWCWYYGGGFSGRPFIDIYPLIIISILVLISEFSLMRQRLTLCLTIPFIFVNQIMAYQYSHLIMDGGQMDKNKYWDIFLETDYATINKKRIATLTKKHSIFKMDSLTYENEALSPIITDFGFNSGKSNIVGKSNLYSIGFNLTLKEIGLSESEPFYVLLECDTKELEGKNNKMNLVLTVFDKENCVRWDVVYSSQFNKSEDNWKHMTYVARISDYELKDGKVIKLFAMCDNGNNAVDNLKYSLVKE